MTGGDPSENAARLRALLDGKGLQAERDIVALNTAALLTTAGLCSDLLTGVEMAREAIDSRKAGAVLDAYVEASRG